MLERTTTTRHDATKTSSRLASFTSSTSQGEVGSIQEFNIFEPWLASSGSEQAPKLAGVQTYVPVGTIPPPHNRSSHDRNSDPGLPAGFGFAAESNSVRFDMLLRRAKACYTRASENLFKR